jgi:hypothetical protein
LSKTALAALRVKAVVKKDGPSAVMIAVQIGALSAVGKMKAIAEAASGHLRFPEIHSLRNPMKHKNLPNLKAVQPRGRPAPNRLQRVLVCRPTSSPNAK